MKTPLDRLLEEVREEVLMKFWSSVAVSKPGLCWLWRKKASPQGYGRFCFRRTIFRAHAVSWTIKNGPIPKGHVIDHICMNKLCVNPNHLRAVTPRINAIENSNSAAASNARKTCCPYGHPYSGDNLILTTTKKTGYQLRKCRTCVKAWREKYNELRRSRKRDRIAEGSEG